MKYILPLLVFSTAHAATLTVDVYDQVKLAHFLRKLPANIAPISEESFSGGRRVHSKLVRPAVKINCSSEFFGGASVPSNSECSISIDENHQALEKNYDEWRIPDTSAEVASALHAIMPHGTETKSFRAGTFEQGTDFNGRTTNIFDFLFECSKTSCLYRFSEKRIK
jgi:hypothetical protein